MVVQLVNTLITPVIEDLGFSLWGVEYLLGGRQSTLRVYINSDEGIDVDDCAKVSREISALLDVEDSINGTYILEVSSPGLDCLLFYPHQYAYFLGETVKLRLNKMVHGRRRCKAVIEQVNDKAVTFLIDGEQSIIPFEGIERARIIPQW